MKTDLNQLRFNQFFLTLLIPLAVLTGQHWLVGVLFVLMISQHLGFDGLVWLKKRSGVGPFLRDEDPRPHRFARTVGAVFLGAATLGYVLGWTALGSSLALTVAALALLNLTTKICVGCFMYFQLRMLRYRLGGQ
ncbi:MAG: DUF4395 domain-containing protein [Meiothermus sp.]|nr:DUF4395 domain-containing protein [Meiothermus sp.]